MNAFQFGRMVRIKLAAGPSAPAPTSSLTGTPTLPTQPPQGSTMSLARSGAPKPQTSVSGSGMQLGGPQKTTPMQSSPFPQNPETTWTGYITGKNGLRKDVGDYFTHKLPETFNPWSQDYQSAGARYKNLPVDAGIRRGAQASAAVGAAAGVGAAGLAAAAPAVGSMTMGQLGTAAAGAGGAATAKGNELYAKAQDFGSRMFERLPHPVQQFHERLENTPVSQALHPTTGVGRAMNPLNTVGDPLGAVPHSITVPYEAAHLVSHNLTGHGDAHGGVTHAGAH